MRTFTQNHRSIHALSWVSPPPKNVSSLFKVFGMRDPAELELCFGHVLMFLVLKGREIKVRFIS